MMLACVSCIRSFTKVLTFVEIVSSVHQKTAKLRFFGGPRSALKCNTVDGGKPRFG